MHLILLLPLALQYQFILVLIAFLPTSSFTYFTFSNLFTFEPKLYAATNECLSMREINCGNNISTSLSVFLTLFCLLLL
jgi:hypothetical protein